MNKTRLIIIIIVISFILIIIFTIPPLGWKAKIVSPMGQGQVSPAPTPIVTLTPPNAPKTFQFDESTDLKMELENINPAVLDSDFE